MASSAWQRSGRPSKRAGRRLDAFTTPTAAVQYACHEYVRYLEDHELVPSMSAKGYCYDNAFMESFFKTLKAEEVYLTEYEGYADVLESVPQFIEAVYNRKRMHSSLGYLPPNEFEQMWTEGVLR